MPYSRSIPSLLVGLLVPLFALAQAPAPPPAVVPPVDSAGFAQNVLTDTLIKLRLRERIAAKIEQKVSMLNQEFGLEGAYYKDTGHRVRLQLDLHGLGDAGSKMLQVCDGKVLWDFQKVLNMQNYRRRDLTPILKRLADPAIDDYFRNQVVTRLGLGGPEALLFGFQEKVKFDQFADEAVDGVPSYILGGTWKDRAGLMSQDARPLPPTSPLPPYVPSNIRVWIDKATSWPYRIEMIGNAPSLLQEEARAIGPDGRPVGVKKAPPKVDPSRITMKYTLLPLTEINDALFVFSAPRDSTNLIDDTDQFMAGLDQFIQLEANRRKAEAAAKNEGDQQPLKVDPIDVTNPGSPGGAASGLGTLPGPASPK